MASNTKIKLKNILELKEYMKIAIDTNVDTDENGNYLINVAYLRVSTTQQADDGYGLEVQEKEVLKYAKIHELDNLVIFKEDHTGTTMDRPVLNHIVLLIERFNSGRTKIRLNSFIVPRIDRLGRTLFGTLQFIQDYIVCQKDSKNSHINRNKEDISFISVAEKDCRFDKEDPRSKFLFMLFATLAEFDRDMIVQKLQKGRLARIEDGKWMGGGKLPYGYTYDKKLGKLIVVPEEAEKVKEIFRLYIEEKLSPQKIAIMLGMSGERVVAQILRRKSLTGCIIYKGKEYPGEHQAIVSLERWNEAQEELEKRSIYRGDSHYLLSGLVYCGVCGARCRYQKWDKKTGECKLVCYSHQKSKPYLVKAENCDNKLFWAGDIENAVTKMLFNFASEINAENKKETAYIDPTASIRAELIKAQKHLSKLYDFEDEDEPDEILKDKISKARLKINELTALLMDTEKQAEIERKVEKAQQIFKNLEAAWEFMSQEEKQAVCRELIKSVIIHKNGTVHLDLKIQSYIVKNDPESIE